MKWLKKITGLLVGKIALISPLLPIGRWSVFKWIYARLSLTPHEVILLNSLFGSFKHQNDINQIECPEKALVLNRELLVTNDGAKLDTLECYSKKNQHCKEYVIMAWGRGDCYELELNRIATDALNLNKKIISFNYRGVAYSEGNIYSEQELVNDIVFQVNRLLEQGVKPENIWCYGHSLGGGVVTLAVAKLHQENKPVYLFNDRSFANLIDTTIHRFFHHLEIRKTIVKVSASILMVAAALCLRLFDIATLWQMALCLVLGVGALKWERSFAYIDKTLGNSLEKIVRSLLHYSNWGMNAVQAYDEIPSSHKRHIVLKKPYKKTCDYFGEKVVLEPNVDLSVPYPTSLHAHTKGYRLEKLALEQAILQASDEEEREKYKQQLRKLSYCKLTGGDHTSEPKYLVTWFTTQAGRTLTGQEVFYDFVEPTENHVGADAREYQSFI